MKGVPWMVGHRGASQAVWENTQGAFAEAWRQGADAVEGDFHLTADGVLLCHHNEDLPDGSLLRDLSYADLQGMAAQQYESWQRDAGLLPTALEVMNGVPKHKSFLLEVKCGVEAVPALAAALGESVLRPEQLWVIAFDWEVVAAVKQECAGVRAMGIFDFKAVGRDAITAQLPALIDALLAMGADGLSSNNTLAWHQEHESMLCEAGLLHNVWTVDDEASAQHFSALQVHSISSNKPAWLRAQISSK